MQDCTMTRTWLQRFMQRNDTDLLSYDFADSCPTLESWCFRCSIAAVCIGILAFFWPLLT